MPKGKGRPKTEGNKGVNNNPKLRLFQGSDVANKRGAAFNPDGSIMRRSEAIGTTSPVSGEVRSLYGVNKREPIYDYGFGREGKLVDAVANKGNKRKETTGGFSKMQVKPVSKTYGPNASKVKKPLGKAAPKRGGK